MKTTNNTAEALELVVLNTYVLYVKVQNYHWNVTGPNFKALHELFEMQYEELAKAIDLLAERVRALNQKVRASLSFFLEKTVIQQPENEHNFSDFQMLQELIKYHSILVEEIIKKAFKVASNEEDEATANMLAERIEAHEKFIWMMNSILVNQSNI